MIYYKYGHGKWSMDEGMALIYAMDSPLAKYITYGVRNTMNKYASEIEELYDSERKKYLKQKNK